MEFPGRSPDRARRRPDRRSLADVADPAAAALQSASARFSDTPSKTYPGIWLAHTAFGMPLAIYLLRNYMAGLPKEIIESARVDGASEFDIFTRIVLPLSFPALASFSIFQFLWVWNDLLGRHGLPRHRTGTTWF
jgi:ABC-type spermidine/putrescine transport system permease subunit II